MNYQSSLEQETPPNILCNRYLTSYKDDGWIDSKVDTLDDKIR